MSELSAVSIASGKRWAAVGLIALAAMGCHTKVARQLPKTYPVKGRVVASQGQLPAAGSMILFEPASAELVAKGKLEADGGFALSTLFHDQVLDGAAEGSYDVSVLPVVGNMPGPPISVTKRCVVQPKENNFIIDLNKVVASPTARR
jgi:hypothetical protein